MCEHVYVSLSLRAQPFRRAVHNCQHAAPPYPCAVFLVFFWWWRRALARDTARSKKMQPLQMAYKPQQWARRVWVWCGKCLLVGLARRMSW